MIASSFQSWQDGRQPGTRWSGSANLRTIRNTLFPLITGQDLGYGVNRRPIRGGAVWSDHAFGSAWDWGYGNGAGGEQAHSGPGRIYVVDVFMPWLIANSAELGIQRIHDYIAKRIWQAGAGWTTKNPGSGANWIHTATHPDSYADDRPLSVRGLTPLQLPSGALHYFSTPAPTPARDILRAGQSLARGEQLTSADGGTVFAHQADGNVVLYVSGRAVWNTETSNRPTTVLVMQGDANLVLYNGVTVLWASGTHGHTDGALVVHPGRAFILGPNWSVLWATNTAPVAAVRPPVVAPRRTTIVRTGEGWWQLSARTLGTGARWKEIAALNGGERRTLQPGDTVRLP
ncbi:hypothetical protein [Gemmatimonas sp.]|uniref:hypothetical protein n=1 Tax=Gemmatimonas sp. TaxID=1962908 RepID=UPI00356774AE